MRIFSFALHSALTMLIVSSVAYSKLHSSLVNSSLWSEDDHVRLLFITLLALCDKDGCVYGSRIGLQRAAAIDPDQCAERDPWDVLTSPDKHSSDRMRAPENEGRRIEEIPGGFRLLNFAYYRGLRNDDDRAEQNRQAQHRHRSKLASAAVSHGQPASSVVSPRKPSKAHTEAEAEAEAETEAETEAHSSSSSGTVPVDPAPEPLKRTHQEVNDLINRVTDKVRLRRTGR